MVSRTPNQTGLERTRVACRLKTGSKNGGRNPRSNGPKAGKGDAAEPPDKISTRHFSRPGAVTLAMPIDVTSTRIDGQQTYDGGLFPTVWMCNGRVDLSAALDWVGDSRSDLLARLASCGTVPFRDFPLHGVEDFDAFVRAFDLPNFAYNESLSNAVCVNWTDRVFSANRVPSRQNTQPNHNSLLFRGLRFVKCSDLDRSWYLTNDANFFFLRDQSAPRASQTAQLP